MPNAPERKPSVWSPQAGVSGAAGAAPAPALALTLAPDDPLLYAVRPDNREFCAVFESRRLARRIAGFYARHVAARIALPALAQDQLDHVAAMPLSLQQFSLLGFVLVRPGLPAQDYARLLDVDRSTVTRNLALLERRGLVQQPPDPADRRRRRPLATRDGRMAWRAGLAAWRRAQDLFKREIGGAVAFEALLGLLRHTATALPPAADGPD